jgi:2-polyprenyl-6-hydroxyphenyl methylase/3-demethylubiquinone-9 3-methyltransferase
VVYHHRARKVLRPEIPLPKGTHDHAKFIRPAELIRCCDSADLLTKQVKGVRYNPLTEHFKLSDDVSVNYQIFCEKP